MNSIRAWLKLEKWLIDQERKQELLIDVIVFGPMILLAIVFVALMAMV